MEPLARGLSEKFLARQTQPLLVELGVDAASEPGALAHKCGAVESVFCGAVAIARSSLA